MSQGLSQEFHRLALLAQEKDMTVKELMQHVSSRAQALPVLILSLPFLFLIPLPGYSVVVGIFIFFNGYRVASQGHMWFPLFIQKYKFSGKSLAKGFFTAQRTFKRIEHLIRPRGVSFHHHKAVRIVNGTMLALCGFFLALPLPPGTNFLPGLTTCLLSLSLMEEDSVLLSISYLFFLLTLAFFILLPILGIEGLMVLFQKD